MAGNSYAFLTRWVLDASLDEVNDILGDAERLPDWWPSVYLGVQVVEPGGPGGVGKVVDLHTKGWLPYTLRWRFRTVESRKPHGWTLEAEGDFVGRGVWTFRELGERVEVTYDWRIRAEKPVLRALSWVMKPVFSANHHWAMARGFESLQLEVARRRAPTPMLRAQIPPPPGPTWPHRRPAPVLLADPVR